MSILDLSKKTGDPIIEEYNGSPQEVGSPGSVSYSSGASTSSISQNVDILRREYDDDPDGLFASLLPRQLGFSYNTISQLTTMIWKDEIGGRHEWVEGSSGLWESDGTYTTLINSEFMKLDKAIVSDDALELAPSGVDTEALTIINDLQKMSVYSWDSAGLAYLDLTLGRDSKGTTGSIDLNVDGTIDVNGDTTIDGNTTVRTYEVYPLLDEASRNTYELTYIDKATQTLTSNSSVYTDASGALHVDNDIIQSGSSYETHVEQVYTTKDEIITRDGAVGGLAPTEYTGIRAKLYDGVNDGLLVFGNDGYARVGDEGDLKILSARDEDANLTQDNVLYWDDTEKILKDTGVDYNNLAVSSDLSDYVSKVDTNPQTMVSDLTMKSLITTGTATGYYGTRSDTTGRLFYWNGGNDIFFGGTNGSGGRALVHNVGNILTLNYGNDFDNVEVQSQLVINTATGTPSIITSDDIMVGTTVVTSQDTGFRINLDQNNDILYIDHKAKDGENIRFRCGGSTQLGHANTYQYVEANTGDVRFLKNLGIEGITSVDGSHGIVSSGWLHLHRYASSTNVAVGNNGSNVDLLVSNGDLTVGNFKAGAWPGNTDYASIGHVNYQGSTEYQQIFYKDGNVILAGRDNQALSLRAYDTGSSNQVRHDIEYDAPYKHSFIGNALFNDILYVGRTGNDEQARFGINNSGNCYISLYSATNRRGYIQARAGNLTLDNGSIATTPLRIGTDVDMVLDPASGDVYVDGVIKSTYYKVFSSGTNVTATLSGSMTPNGTSNFLGQVTLNNNILANLTMASFTGNTWGLSEGTKYYMGGLKIVASVPQIGLNCQDEFYIIYEAGSTRLRSPQARRTGDTYNFTGFSFTIRR